MRFAYLIIAHNEFEVLKRLVSELDDVRNDIYIHFDKKVKALPKIEVRHSNLYILDKRIDVRWGHVSQIKTEMLLFETALQNGPYEYYHLISGTHMPLKSQDELRQYFSDKHGKSVIYRLVKDDEYQETLKMHRISLFMRGYSSGNRLISRCAQFMWKACIALQRIFHITVNNGFNFYKASNWVSLTQEAVEYLVEHNKTINRRYRHSFCGDEYFVPSELLSSPLLDQVAVSPLLLKCDIRRAHPEVFHLNQLDELRKTEYMFARKFTAQ